MVTTNPWEGTAKQGEQIAKLMATLTQNRQGSSHCSAPGSPQECGHGWGHSGRGTPSCTNSHNSRGGPSQFTPACSLPTEWGVEGKGSWGSDQGNCRPSVRGRVQLVAETHTLSRVLDARVGAIWLENALPQCQP